MGQDAGQIIGSLNRNTAAAHQAVGQLDVAPLEGAVHNRVDMINDLSDEGLGYWDKVREVANVKEHPVGEILHDENGNVLYLTDENGKPIKDSDGEYITLYHFLNAEDEQHLQAGSDGNRRMFYNGIFNTPDEAAGNAVHLADNEHEPLYFTYHPQAKDKLVEFGVAIYEYFGGWSNSTKKFQDFASRYGNDGAIVSAHSRGSLTVGNGLRDFEKRGIHGIAEKTDIYLYGPADHAQSIANALYVVSDGKNDHVYLQSHASDPISTLFGYNAPTFYKVPLNLDVSLLEKGIKNPLYMTLFVGKSLLTTATSPLIEGGRALGGYDPSPHNCYGDASKACITNYGTSPTKQIHSIYSTLDHLWKKK
ncbi:MULTISPECIES: filamentous hemagglutinin [unclassified Bartonella]|uniref:filamentous hemagglutinin n=1 Tax=unclassified Bartonella TaxID=2645622 RepID=UPI0035D04233